MTKGFVMDADPLKQRVRSIRASERRIWPQITDIFQEHSIDYDKIAKVTRYLIRKHE